MLGKTGALLLYAASTSVNWYTLKSNHLKRVAGNLNQAIGVGYDGNHIYWTNILVGAESIMKARMDGSEVMVKQITENSLQKSFHIHRFYSNLFNRLCLLLA